MTLRQRGRLQIPEGSTVPSSNPIIGGGSTDYNESIYFFNMQMFYVHHETFVVINSGSHCAAWRVSVIQCIGILVEKPYQPTEEVLFTQPL